MKYALLFLSVLLTACAAPRNAFESSPINDKALQASFNALYRSVTGKKGTKNSEFIAALSAYQQQETFNCFSLHRMADYLLDSFNSCHSAQTGALSGTDDRLLCKNCPASTILIHTRIFRCGFIRNTTSHNCIVDCKFQ